MKKFELAAMALAVALSSATTLAQGMDSMKGMPMDSKPASTEAKSQTHHAMGIVKKIDAKTGVLTIAHAPVKSLSWPAMTMGFQVKDRMLLDNLTVDKPIEFDFQQGSKGYVLTAVK